MQDRMFGVSGLSAQLHVGKVLRSEPGHVITGNIAHSVVRGGVVFAKDC